MSLCALLIVKRWAFSSCDQRPLHEGVVERAAHAARADHRVELLDRQPRLARDRQRLGVQRRIAHRDEVVDQLHLVAQAHRPEVHHVAGPAAQHRLDAREDLGRRRRPWCRACRPRPPWACATAARRRSARRAPCASAASASVDTGLEVEQSMMIVPGLAPASSPSGPRISASTCGEPVTHRWHDVARLRPVRAPSAASRRAERLQVLHRLAVAVAHAPPAGSPW